MFRVSPLAVWFLAASTASACLWNIDTTVFESLHVRELDESLFGYFRRHSTELYQWRVADREARLAETPDDLDLIDDLAVSYEKTGQVEKAIALLEPVVELHPERYTALANLGTMYVHAGDFERGEALIQRAIDVNPDAHFGREKIQLILVQYVQSRQVDGEISLPIASDGDNFARFAFRRYWRDSPEDWTSEADFEDLYWLAGKHDFSQIVNGISGMMRFGDHESPILFETMGDVLSKTKQTTLAAVAYRRAADVTEGGVSDAYRMKSDVALDSASEKDRDLFESDYREHASIAAEYFAEVEAFEAAAIDAYVADKNANPNPDDAFFARYSEKPGFDEEDVRRIVQRPNARYASSIVRSSNMRIFGAVVAGFLSIVAITMIVFRKLNQASQNPSSSS